MVVVVGMNESKEEFAYNQWLKKSFMAGRGEREELLIIKPSHPNLGF